MKDLVLRKETPDGKFRVSIYLDDYADNPRLDTDEPMHCIDWGASSIMTKREPAEPARNARDFLCKMLDRYGNWAEIVSVLVDNGKHIKDGRAVCGDALVYDRQEREWQLFSRMPLYDPETRRNKCEWQQCKSYNCRRSELWEYIMPDDDFLDSTIEFLVNNCMYDSVKIASYQFIYQGGISFSDYVRCDSDGFAWLLKDEYMKYTGCSGTFWKNPFTAIEWQTRNLDAWRRGEVYYYVVEKSVSYRVHKECLSEEREPVDYTETEWEEIESCHGYVGSLGGALEDACYCCDLTPDTLVDHYKAVV